MKEVYTNIQNDLPSIQQYLSKHSSEKLSNLGADDREAIERVFELFKGSQGARATGSPATRLNEDVIHRLVLEQESLIKPMHKVVQNILADFLRNNGCRDVCVEQGYVDVSQP